MLPPGSYLLTRRPLILYIQYIQYTGSYVLSDVFSRAQTKVRMVFITYQK